MKKCPSNWDNSKRKLGQNLSGSQKKRNRKHSSIRARVEHVFRVIKQQFVFTRTRYRGLMKNAVQMNMLMGLANLYLLRRNCWLLEGEFAQNTPDSGR
ncbi:MAG: transposase [Nitrosomonas sp.]|jgi:transposase, IS5 family|nr:transposase [Nitrosomonas sp.]